jgi:penicillin-binding protein 1A
MRQALTGKALTERTPPPGVSYVDGDWVYDEFAGDAGVKALDVEVSPLDSIFDAIRKMFGG